MSGARRYIASYDNMYEAQVVVTEPPRLSRDIRTLSEFRANTAKFVRHVQETRRPLVLTQHGRGAAVLLDVGEYERLVERAELAEDVRVAEAQLARGEGVRHEEAKERIRTRRRR
ncbi:MAG: type II toxin-antitoxin system Phd/YefM family antitoxin [Gemmatimonadota bacterium]